MFIDTHAHLDFDSYNEDREIVIQRAIENNISAIITIGTNIESSEESIILSGKYAALFAAVGIHPSDCLETTEQDYTHLEELAQNEKVVAIGEVGLDYYRMYAPKEIQIESFRRQIRLAKKLQLPLIIHNREAHEDVLRIIEEEDAGAVGGVFHSFTGDDTFLERILVNNFYVSYTGNITFKKSDSETLIRNTPAERLLLETDSPFLTPTPLRGKRNEPAFLVHTVDKIAGIKNISREELGSITSGNAKSLFGIDV
jgi:TatD DNase family protein